MRPPTLVATMERRVLVNYRVDPEALAGLVPRPFRPLLVDDHGIAGMCLLRLGAIRPARSPVGIGVSSENAAHRIAVEWDTPDGAVTGVYIPRRDTSSRVAALLGGRAFPGWHHRARFRVTEGNGLYRVEASSRDGEVAIHVAARATGQVMAGSVFASVEDASSFFGSAPFGYAATPSPGLFDGVELTIEDYAMAPLCLEEVRSSFFDDPVRFPAGTVEPDSAFLMADLVSTWRPLPSLDRGGAPESTPQLAAL